MKTKRAPGAAANLRTLYLVGLAGIATVAIVGQIVFQASAQSQAEDVHVMNVMGRQRTLGQRVLSDSLLALRGPEQERARATARLREVVADWQSAHAELVSRGGPKNVVLPDRTLGHLMRSENHLKQSLAEVDRALATEGIGAERADAVIRELVGNSILYLEAVEAAVTEWESEALSKAQSLRRTQFWLTGLILALLLCEAVFIFRPAFRWLQRSFGELAEARDRIAEQHDQLRDQQMALELRHQRLLAVHAKVKEAYSGLQLVTEQHQVSAKRFQDLFQNVPIACYTYDRDGLMFEWNKEAAELYGRGPWEIFHKNCFETLYTEEEGAFMRMLSSRAFDGGAVRDVECKIRRADGTVRSVISKVIPLHNSAGKVVGALNASIDITESRMPDSPAAPESAHNRDSDVA
jgi:PAS domain S-box-containing protein